MDMRREMVGLGLVRLLLQSYRVGIVSAQHVSTPRSLP